jgi:hypothetical protein
MKKTTILALPCAIALMTVAVEPSLAAVNCGLVKKEIERGKKEQDVAENMGISVKEVQTCKAETGGATGDTHKSNTPMTQPTGTPQQGAPSPGAQGK